MGDGLQPRRWLAGRGLGCALLWRRLINDGDVQLICGVVARVVGGELGLELVVRNFRRDVAGEL